MAYWFDFGGGVVPTSFRINPSILITMFEIPKPSTDFDKYDEPRLHIERLMKARLVEFDLSLRILCSLESAGITTLGDLVKQTRVSLKRINQLGKISVCKLEDFLAYHGLSLANNGRHGKRQPL